MKDSLRFYLAIFALALPIALIVYWLQMPKWAIMPFILIFVFVFFRFSPLGGMWWMLAIKSVLGVYNSKSIPPNLISYGHALSHELAHVVDFELGEISKTPQFTSRFLEWKFQLDDEAWDDFFEGTFEFEGAKIQETNELHELYADIYYYSVVAALPIPEELQKFYPLERFRELEEAFGNPELVYALFLPNHELIIGAGERYRPSLMPNET